ncbi:MAG TPA: exosortase/archaeosortase family protein [Chthoniobacter sp.]|jgi:exosortase
MTSDVPAAPASSISSGEMASRVLAWARREPLGAFLLLASLAVLVYFFGFYKVFMNGGQSTAEWAWRGWNEENDQQHCWLLPPVILFVLWYQRDDLLKAAKAPSLRGMAFVIAGVLLFVMAVRCIQARLAILSLPILTYGMAEYLGGRKFARSFIFPCLLMLFMVPVGGIIQGTVTLQLLASKTVGALCGLLGIHVQIIGTKIGVDGNSFEVAGGCSGIRSLMAMTLLSALYVFFAISGTWRQWTVFAGSIVFALIGNVARLFTVVLVAKWWDPQIAGGLYHEYSGFVFFPIAVLAMVSFGNLLSRDWASVSSDIAKKLSAPEAAPASKNDDIPADDAPKPGSPISYDY